MQDPLMIISGRSSRKSTPDIEALMSSAADSPLMSRPTSEQHLNLESAGNNLETISIPDAQSIHSIHTMNSFRRRTDKKQFVGSMESMQRIVSAELHFAKKDPKLLELFIQSGPSADGTVTPDMTVDIVHDWLKPEKIEKETIWQLLKLLEIQPEDRLKHIEVAKIASVVASALQRSVALKSTTGTKRLQSYEKLRSTQVKVTFNSMGERVIERKELPKDDVDGIFNGLTSTIRKIWNKQPARVIHQADIKNPMAATTPLKLQAIPPLYKSLVLNRQQPLRLPDKWSAETPHYFDPWRVLRIVRTLLDMRSSKQHEAFQRHCHTIGEHVSSEIDTLPKILVQHLESTFGDTRLNVSNDKIAHFLEACLQYNHLPVVSMMSRMLRIDPKQPNDRDVTLDCAVWATVELRSMLMSRGCVLNGPLVYPYDMDKSEVAVRDGLAQQVRYQHVSRADALNAADEMLRLRGQYGPKVYLHIFNMIECMSTIEESDTLLDLEMLLDNMLFELIRFEEMILETENNVFGENCFPVGIAAVPRDIGTKRKLIIDDQDFQFGAFHVANLNVIKRFLLDFILEDPVRVGTLERQKFNGVLRDAAFNKRYLGRNISLPLIVAFENLCDERFCDTVDATDQTSYVDLIISMLAWEGNTQGEVEISLDLLLQYIPQIKRGIENTHANELVRYCGCLRTSSMSDSFWTMGQKGVQDNFIGSALMPAGFGIETKQLTLSVEGNWNPNTVPTSDEPGHLVARKALLNPVNQVRPSALEGHIKLRESQMIEGSLPTSKIMPTQRPLNTLQGEVLQAFRPRMQANLSVKSFNPDLIASQPAVQLELDYSVNNKGSYSRSIEQMEPSVDLSIESLGSRSLRSAGEQRIQQVTSPKSNPIIFGSQEAIENSPRSRPHSRQHSPKQLHQQRRPGSAGFDEYADADGGEGGGGVLHLIRKEDSMLSDSNYENYTIDYVNNEHLNPSDFVSNNEVNQSLAVVEARHRLHDMKQREEELDMLMQMEKEAFALRKEARDIMRHEERRLAKLKERQSKEFAEFEAEERFRKKQEMRKAAQEALAAENAAKEAEMARLMERNRLRNEQKANEKLLQERLEAEQEARENENFNMGSEERYMRLYLKKLADKNARDEEERIRKEQEDFEASIAALQSQIPAIEVPPIEPVETDEGEAEHEEQEEEEEQEEAEEAPEEEQEEEPEEPQMEVSLVQESVEVVVEEKEPTEVLEEDEEASVVSIEPLSRPLTAAERRIQQLLRNLEDGYLLHASHPRRQRNGQFFIPQIFSEDIYFNPFAAPSNGQTGASLLAVQQQQQEEEDFSKAMLDIDISESPATQDLVNTRQQQDPFFDIKATVKNYKKQLEKSRKLLFSTSSDDVPAKDWMRIYRTGYVDWNPFFSAERDALDAEERKKLAQQQPEDLSKLEEKKRPKSNSVFDKHAVFDTLLSVAQPIGHKLIPKSLLEMPDDLTMEIIPLPFGKVVRNSVVKKHCYKYFQVEVVALEVVLTVEIRCSKGLADLYLSYAKVPSNIKYEHSASCTKSDDRTGRISFVPTQKGTYMLAVYSPLTGAQFDVWAYCTNDPAEENPSIMKVNTLLRKFKHLIEHEDELEVHFPRLEVEAEQIAEKDMMEKQKSLLNRRSVYLEMKALHGTKQLEDLLEGANEVKTETQEEQENVEMFVVKAGRYAMRMENEQKKMGVKSAAVYGVEDPNHHAELFTRPALPSRHNSMMLLQPVDSLSIQEEMSIIQTAELVQQLSKSVSSTKKGGSVSTTSMMDFYSQTLTNDTSIPKLPSISSHREVVNLQRIHGHLHTSASAPGLSLPTTLEMPTMQQQKQQKATQSQKKFSITTEVKPITYKLNKYTGKL